MKRIFTAIIMTAAVASAAPALAQSSATATANGSTTIIRPITLTKNTDLAFGRIVRPTTGTGTVAIANTADTVTAGSGAVAIASTTSRAQFTIDGEGAQAISVSVPATMTLNGPSASTISVALSGDLGATSTLSGTSGNAGNQTLFVGGSFNLPSTQTTGAYSGTFNVTVAYN